MSAVEEVKNAKSSDAIDIQQELFKLRAGNTRFVDIQQDPLSSPPSRRTENQEITDSERSGDNQPDNEPGISLGNSERNASGSEYTPTEPPENQEEGPSIPEMPTPENVPVPVEEDDDLFCEACTLTDDQAWRFEVSLDLQDIDALRNDPNPEQVAFIVSASKKQKTEVKMSTLTSEERKLFEEAKQKEIQSWLDTRTVCRILRQKIPESSILRCRWILTWKDAENNTHLGVEGRQSQNRKAKARLVILGYQDPELSNLERDSPTLSKLSRNLLLQLCVSNKWEIGSFDIKTAFLRGRADSRILGLEPPPELRAKLGLQPQEVCRLLKGAYGLVNAPLLWFRELTKTVSDLGFIAAPFDPCCFILSNEQGQARGSSAYMWTMVCSPAMNPFTNRSTSSKVSFLLEAERRKILCSQVSKSIKRKTFPSQ